MTKNLYQTICAFVMMCGLLLPATQGATAELVDVRTGFHTTYTRIVLQFNQHIIYHLNQDEALLRLNISGITSEPYFNVNRLLRGQDLITDIRYEHVSSELKVRIKLATEQVQVFSDLYAEPTRLVIDLYPTRVVTPATSPEPDSVTSDDSLKTLTAFTEQDTDSVNFSAGMGADSARTIPYQNFLNSENIAHKKMRSDETKRSTPAERAKGGDRNISTAILIIAAFILIDAVMFTVLFLNRKKKKKSAPQSASTELPQPVDFAAVLNSMRAGPSAEPNPVRDVSFIDADKVPHDFEAMQLSGNIPKEYWLGQDGMKLLERLHRGDRTASSKNSQPPVSN